jgi:hypothetical protein
VEVRTFHFYRRYTQHFRPTRTLAATVGVLTDTACQGRPCEIANDRSSQRMRPLEGLTEFNPLDYLVLPVCAAPKCTWMLATTTSSILSATTLPIITHTHVDLESLGRELGVLKDWEQVGWTENKPTRQSTSQDVTKRDTRLKQTEIP